MSVMYSYVETSPNQDQSCRGWVGDGDRGQGSGQAERLRWWGAEERGALQVCMAASQQVQYGTVEHERAAAVSSKTEKTGDGGGVRWTRTERRPRKREETGRDMLHTGALAL